MAAAGLRRQQSGCARMICTMPMNPSAPDEWDRRGWPVKTTSSFEQLPSATGSTASVRPWLRAELISVSRWYYPEIGALEVESDQLVPLGRSESSTTAATGWPRRAAPPRCSRPGPSRSRAA
jgi:hypothetical protein